MAITIRNISNPPIAFNFDGLVLQPGQTATVDNDDISPEIQRALTVGGRIICEDTSNCNSTAFAGVNSLLKKDPFNEHLRKGRRRLRIVTAEPQLQPLDVRFGLILSLGAVDNITLPDLDHINDVANVVVANGNTTISQTVVYTRGDDTFYVTLPKGKYTEFSGDKFLVLGTPKTFWFPPIGMTVTPL